MSHPSNAHLRLRLTTPTLLPEGTCPLTPPHQRAHRSAPSYSDTGTSSSDLRTFVRQITHVPPHICTPSYATIPLFWHFRRRHRPTAAHLCPLTQARTRPPLRKFAPFSTEGAEQLYDGNGAVVPYKRIVAPMLFERLYGGIGEKSIGCPRKVYRVFPESL